jgi:hypothetical protein
MWESRAHLGRDFSKPRRESTLSVDFLGGVIFHRPPLVSAAIFHILFPDAATSAYTAAGVRYPND